MVGSTPTRFRQMLDDSIAFVGVRTQMWHLSRGFCSQVVPNLWGEPLRWHNFLGHSFRFRKSVLASPSRIRGLGKGATSPPSPEKLSIPPACFHRCSQKTPSLRFEIRPNLTPRSVARTLREIDSPAPSATAADCNTARRTLRYSLATVPG